MLTRDQILSIDDVTGDLLPVEVPEWGGTVLIRPMSGLARERFEAALTSDKPRHDLRAMLAASVICDDKGRLLFLESDVKALSEKSNKPLHRLYEIGIKHSAIGKKSVDELEKNSGAATSDDTPSASRPDTTSPTSTGS